MEGITCCSMLTAIAGIGSAAWTTCSSAATSRRQRHAIVKGSELRIERVAVFVIVFLGGLYAREEKQARPPKPEEREKEKIKTPQQSSEELVTRPDTRTYVAGNKAYE